MVSYKALNTKEKSEKNTHIVCGSLELRRLIYVKGFYLLTIK